MTIEWRKPEPGDHRSPCPALNALANGGHLPHDGKVTVAELVTAIETALGVSPLVGAKLANFAMNKLGRPGPGGEKVLLLSDLALHGFIEHDASLTRRDAHKGNAVEMLPPLVDQLVALSQDGKTLTLDDLAVAHQLRMAQSAADGHGVPLEAAVLGTLEAALLFKVLARGGAIAVPDLVEFLGEERIPAHLAPRPIGVADIAEAAATIAVRGNVPGCDAAKRAQKAIREVIEPEVSRCPVAGNG
jgi:hypothetical protein